MQSSFMQALLQLLSFIIIILRESKFLNICKIYLLRLVTTNKAKSYDVEFLSFSRLFMGSKFLLLPQNVLEQYMID